MKIHLTNTYCYIDDLKGYLQKSLEEKISYQVYNQESNRYDSISMLYQVFDNPEFKFKIPVGLVSELDKVLNHFSITPEITVSQGKSIKPIALSEGFNGKLRHYQLDGYKAALKARRGILWHCTGSGKTITASALIYSLNAPTLYIVPTTILLNQTYKEVLKFTDYPIGRYGEGYKQINKMVTIATYQGITYWLRKKPNKNKEWSKHQLKERAKFIEFLRTIKVVLIDESHHLRSDSLQKISYACKNANYRIGLTGTAEVKDNQGLLLWSVTGPVIHRVTTSDMIEQGFLSKPYFWFLKYEEGRDKYKKLNFKLNWARHTIYKGAVVNNIDYNRQVAKVALRFVKKGLQTIITVDQIKQGTILADTIKDSVLLTGAMTPDNKRNIIRRFESGRIRVLIATSLINEGFDVPACDVLIKAGSKKSEIADTQRIGRVLRVTKDKKRCLIIDFINYQHYGLVNWATERIKNAKKERAFVINVDSIDGFFEKKIKELYNDTPTIDLKPKEYKEPEEVKHRYSGITAVRNLISSRFKDMKEES